MNNNVNVREILDNPNRGSGPECDTVISSRVRLARNIADYPFPVRLNSEGRKKVEDAVKHALAGRGGSQEYRFVNFAELSALEADAFAEQRIVSPDFAKSEGERELIADIKNGVYVMLNEEDHLRIQCIKPGFTIDEAFEQADGFDNLDLNYAYSEELGYLTQCPTNLGTGLRASVMTHLPALTLTRRIERIAADLPKLGLTMRGFYGEGSEVGGDLYQISNNITLGVSEEQTLEKIKSVAEKIIELERATRNELFKSEQITDKIKRSYGILKHAHLISSSEFLQLYSAVRLGIAYGVIKDSDYTVLDGLLAKVMPANLTLNNGGQAAQLNRDTARAAYIQEVI